jgi:hypothetical protein
MIFYKLYVHLINKKNNTQSSGSCFSENSTQLMCSLIFFVDKYLITLISTINIMNLYFIKVRLNQNERMKSSISKNWPEKFEGFLPWEFLYSNFWKIEDFINTFWLNLTFKGQLISKKNVKPRILPKNERLNSFLLVWDVFSFIFWENPRPEKNVSRLSDL